MDQKRPWLKSKAEYVDFGKEQLEDRASAQLFLPERPVVNFIKRDRPFDFEAMPLLDKPLVPYKDRTDRKPITGSNLPWFMR